MGHPRPCGWRPAEKGLGSSRATLVPVISLHGPSEDESRSPSPSPPPRETGDAAQHPAGRCRRPENKHPGSEQGHGGRGSAELSGTGPGRRGGRHRGSGRKDEQARTNCAPTSRDSNRGDTNTPREGDARPRAHGHGVERWDGGGARPAGHMAHKDCTQNHGGPKRRRRCFQTGIGPFLSFQERTQAMLHPAQMIQEQSAGTACCRSKGRPRGREGPGADAVPELGEWMADRVAEGSRETPSGREGRRWHRDTTRLQGNAVSETGGRSGFTTRSGPQQLCS